MRSIKKKMASIEELEDEVENIEELCIEDKVDSLAISIGTLHKKIDRLLAMLDSRENKKMKDRLRIKQKRDEENASQAAAAGKIVVDRLEGTMHTDPRLPYKLWAYIMLEFGDSCEFLRWLMNEYLESYYCIRDSRRRMIVRKGNHWKIYLKGCGTEKLVTPADMFGGQALKWETMLALVPALVPRSRPAHPRARVQLRPAGARSPTPQGVGRGVRQRHVWVAAAPREPLVEEELPIP